jgi:hypothetical protein
VTSKRVSIVPEFTLVSSNCEPGVIHLAAVAGEEPAYPLPWCMHHQRALVTANYCGQGLDELLADICRAIQS